VQFVQVPLLQTLLLPHDVPFATLPVSAHTDAPVTHDVAPVLHTLAGWQLAPAVQFPQVPLLQTLFVPQVVPLTRFRPVSEQVIDGEHVCVPAWHGFVGMQAVPAVHEVQLPPLHTMLVPHEVPSATFADSTQTGAPVLQVIVPVRHGLPLTAQVAPAVQAPHAPVALHTMLVPHEVPAATSVFLSVQTGAPVVHESAP